MAHRISGQICLATLPEDRFMGIQSAGQRRHVDHFGHHVVQRSGPPVPQCAGGRLALRGGARRFDDTAAAGFSVDDATPLGSGDFLDAIAGWTGGDTLNALAGQTVALRFVMDDATVYGFHFDAAPEPSTIVLLLTGLIGLLVYAWRKRK